MDNKDRLDRLRKMVEAAFEVFGSATSFHEAWRLAAYDRDLHKRLNYSYAAHTFLTIRFALRREMLLALMRLWDTKQRQESVRMTLICEELKDAGLLQALISERKASWTARYPAEPSADLEGDRYGFVSAYRTDEADLKELERDLAQKSTTIRKIILRYSCGNGLKVVEDLRSLRHKRLAHHQINPEVDPKTFDAKDSEIECFYQDNLKLVQLLKSLIEGVGYDPNEMAKIFKQNAELFWASVRGERTEGHPSYKAPPERPNLI